MNKWLALALTFNSHTSSSLPYWKSEFEGLFIFTPRWGVHVRERDMIHRWGHGTADINMILIWCAWDRAEVMKEIKAMKRVRTWDSVHYYRTTAEKHGAGNTPRLNLAFNAPSKSTKAFPWGSNFQDVLFPEGRMIKQICHPPSRLKNNK